MIVACAWKVHVIGRRLHALAQTANVVAHSCRACGTHHCDDAREAGHVEDGRVVTSIELVQHAGVSMHGYAGRAMELTTSTA